MHGRSRRWPRVGDVLAVGLALAVDLLVWGGDSRLRTGGEAPAWVVPVLSVLVLGMLFLRWRHPLPVFGLLYLHGLAGLVLPDYAPFTGLLLALHAVACRTPRAVAVPALLLCVLPIAVDTGNAAPAGTPDQLFKITITGALWSCLFVAVWAFGRTTHAADRRTSLVERLRADEAAEAVRAERRRLARDLHDIVAHAVTTMVLHAAGARTLVDPRDERVRDAAPQDLIAAVRRVAAGEAWIDPAVAGRVIAALANVHRTVREPARLVAVLTPREREVLVLMAHGLSNAEIRDHLVLSEATVKTHVSRIVMKTGSRDRTQAVVHAYRSGLVTPDDPAPQA